MDRNVRLIGLGAGVRNFGLSLFGPFFALYLHDLLGLPYYQVALVLAVLATIPLFTSIGGGLLTDRLGRRRVFLATLAGEAGLTAALGVAMLEGSLVGSLAAAFSAGTVATLGFPSMSAYVADLAQGSERTKGFTWWRVGTNAGFASGVALGGLLVPFLGFGRTTLLSGGILAIATAFLFVTLAPSPVDRELEQGRAPDPTRRGAPRPRTPVRESLRLIAGDPAFLLFACAALVAQITLTQWQNTLSLFAHGPMGISYTEIGLGFSLNGLLVVTTQTATTHAVLGRRLTSLFVVGLVLYAVGFLAFGLSTLEHFWPLEVWFVGVAVLTAGENLVAIPSSTLPSNLAPRGERGAYNGGYSTLSGVGALTGTLAGGIALQTIGDPALLWAVLCLPLLPAVALLRISSRRMAPPQDRA
jgi:MFS family permease